MEEPVEYLDDKVLSVLNQTVTVDRLAAEIVSSATLDDLKYLLIAIIDEVVSQPEGDAAAAKLVLSHHRLLTELLRDYAALAAIAEVADAATH